MEYPLAVIPQQPPRMIGFDDAYANMLNVAGALREKFHGFSVLVELVGSCAIQGEGHDIDVMVKIHEMFVEEVAEWLLENEWKEQDGNQEYGSGEFRSFRSADTNILLVWDFKVYLGWLQSVEVCKHIKTKTRDQRVAIHQIIMDGVQANQLQDFKQVA